MMNSSSAQVSPLMQKDLAFSNWIERQLGQVPMLFAHLVAMQEATGLF
jgi:hypothetical protein